ncbi:uncharacterized protein YpgQ isoform X1 [Hibiscus syriacus]|uniref:uncharacterized protein YpgQ isoform X1 n=1 Tax=Hibiscus syriacus TaxID=106335 RepID=UPI001921BF9A|nr:uncharacterized protein YpgQ isoform X1 [Hibiscus syriacus]
MASRDTVKRAEQLVETSMKGNDASHDALHVWRVRDLALSLAREEGLSSNPDSMEIVELAALLHDIGDYKYLRDPSEEKLVENFLEEEGIAESKKIKILSIIEGLGFKDELAGGGNQEFPPEFGVVQDADRLDAIGAIGIARCFTFGGNRNRVLHDPTILPRSDLSKEQYMKKEEQTTVNHFHEKLLKLKDLMKTKVLLCAIQFHIAVTIISVYCAIEFGNRGNFRQGKEGPRKGISSWRNS